MQYFRQKDPPRSLRWFDDLFGAISQILIYQTMQTDLCILQLIKPLDHSHQSIFACNFKKVMLYDEGG